jgi:hypothetical protein
MNEPVVVSLMIGWINGIALDLMTVAVLLALIWWMRER